MDDGHKRIWVPDAAEIWRLAFVKSRDTVNGTVIVESRDGGEPETYSLDQTHSFDETHESDLDDAAMLNALHEAPLLSLIRRRFESDRIYTNVGGVLISVNPCECPMSYMCVYVCNYIYV
jgi:myosin heavy subunit